MKVTRHANANQDYNYPTNDSDGLMDGKISIDLDLTQIKLKRRFIQSKFMKSGDNNHTQAYEREQQIIDQYINKKRDTTSCDSRAASRDESSTTKSGS